MRFNGHRYTSCRWCSGSGCLYCENEADQAYAREFPEGPKPIATFRLDSPADMERMKSIFGAEALERAFGPEGGGIAEIDEKLRATDPNKSN
jgi:hypothetical protein